ncbi:MAG: CHASE2 domain-containing protein, partial [Myxococcaceae bacterium]
MKKLLSNRRFEVLALAIAIVCVLIHRAADGTPVLDYGGRASGIVKFLRGVQTLESRATDLKFQFRGPIAPHDDVVVAAVDEASAQRFGLWPWSRDLVGKALINLDKMGARAIGLDMFFSDAVEDKGAVAYQKALGELEKTIEAKPELAVELASYKDVLKAQTTQSPDDALAAAFTQVTQSVQGAYAYQDSDADRFGKQLVEQHNELVKPFLITETRLKGGATAELPIDKLDMYTMYAAQSSRPVIAKTASRMGHINTSPDPDGGLRRTPLFVKLTGPKGLLPSLELATAAAYLGGTPNAIYEKSFNRLTGAEIRNKDGLTLMKVPLSDTEPLAYINHIGPA